MKIEEIGAVSFIHPEYGACVFRWQRNSLNNNMMYWFSPGCVMFSGKKSSVRAILKDIELKHPKTHQYHDKSQQRSI